MLLQRRVEGQGPARAHGGPCHQHGELLVGALGRDDVVKVDVEEVAAVVPVGGSAALGGLGHVAQDLAVFPAAVVAVRPQEADVVPLALAAGADAVAATGQASVAADLAVWAC